MKRFCFLFIAAICLLCFSGCGKDSKNTESKSNALADFIQEDDDFESWTFKEFAERLEQFSKSNDNDYADILETNVYVRDKTVLVISYKYKNDIEDADLLKKNIEYLHQQNEFLYSQFFVFLLDQHFGYDKDGNFIDYPSISVEYYTKEDKLVFSKEYKKVIQNW